jgi:hypothetical protein
MADDYKGIKLGMLMTNKNGKKTIKLGSQQEGEKAKYNYTVQLRVLNANGEVVHKVENPWVSLIKPKVRTNAEGEVIPTKVEYELQVFKD